MNCRGGFYTMAAKWRLKGSVLGACNCEHGCPCNFNVAPTNVGCNGVYVWAIQEGHYGTTDLSGLVMAQGGTFPEAIHKGRGEGVYIVDERATPEQRKALEALQKGNGVGLPFDIFAKVTVKMHPTVYAPIEMHIDGIRSWVKIGGGRIYDLGLSRTKNPVTGAEEELYLDKPTGFTSKRTELGMSTVARFHADGIAFDNTGHYAEYGEFDYKGS